MEQIISKIDALLDGKIPQFKKTLKPPASDSEFAKLAELIGTKIPEEFKTFYKQHNGQNLSPYVPFHIETGEILMPITDIIEWYEELNGQLDSGDIDKNRWQKKWVPFTDDGSGNSTCIDISDDNFGQIVYQDDEEYEVRVIFSSLSEWLEDLSNKMKSFDYSTWSYLDRLQAYIG